MTDRVQRSLRRAWQNARPGWTRRVRWYEWRGDEGVSIRLQFEEREPMTGERERVNCFYSDKKAALLDMERFEQGESLRTFLEESE